MSNENINNTKILLKNNFKPRDYQVNIAKTAFQKNTLVVLPTGLGKCHAYNDSILLSGGEIVKIGDIVERSLRKSTKKYVANPIGEITLDNPFNLKVLSLDSTGLKKRKILHFCKFKTNRTLKIITSCGAEINVTPEHPLLTIKDDKLKWLPVKDLSVNDYVAIPREIKIAGRKNQKLNLLKLLKQKLPNMAFWLKLTDKNEITLNKAVKNKINKNKIVGICVKGARAVQTVMKPVWKLTPELCRWLALIIAEGTISSGVKFYNTNKILLEDFKTLTRKIFGIECEEIEGGLAIRSTAVVLFLRFIFDIRSEHSRNKKIPKVVLTASEKEVLAFLKGLYDGEGSININNGIIEFSTASKELANQVCYLLLRNCIRSRKLTKFVKNRPYYRVYIESIKNIKKFAECIGFKHPSKAKRLRIYLKKVKRSGTNIDVVPANDIIKDIRTTLRLKSSKYKDFKNLSDITIYETKKRKPSVEMLKRISKEFNKRYRKIYQSKKEIRHLEECLDLIYSIPNICKELYTRSDFLSIINKANITHKQFDGWIQGNVSPKIRKNAPFIRILKILNKEIDIESLWKSIGKLREVLRISGWELKKNNITYVRCSDVKKLAKLLTYILEVWKSILDCKRKINFLKDLTTLPIIWDKIKIKKDIKKSQFVYDITVEGSHNFIAGENGGVFSHNTFIAILVGIQRLNQYPESKILILSPTRPLSAQHKKSFEEFTSINSEEIVLLTGKIRPEDRAELYKKAKVIIATPQTVEKDLENNRINLKDFSFTVFDEAHRAVKEYSYPYVAKKYLLQSAHPLILGLTASPGATRERINDICNNLFIKAVEIRTEVDTDVEKYIQPIEREFVYVDFPEEFQKIKNLLQEVLKDDLYWLREHHYLPIYKPPKRMLLELQKKIVEKYVHGSRNYALFWAMIRTISAVKIEHAIELLETQGIAFLHDYLTRLGKSKKMADKRIMKDSRMREVVKIVEELHTKGVNHPKLERIVDVVKGLLRENPQIKIIIFANYRATVDRINELLKNEDIKSEVLIGQAIKEGRGLSQEQQIETLKRFSSGVFNVLVTSSIGEEGLDIVATNYAIFYEPVPSEIRTIQRRGRVGRQITGKVIFLITKETRDEAYYFAALQKEKKMKKILYKMKEKGINKKKTLLDWVT